MNKKDPLPPDTQVVEVGIGEGFVRAISHCIIKKKKKSSMPLYSSYGSPLFFFFAVLTNFILKPQTVGRGAMRTSSGTGWAVGAWEAVRRPSMQRNHRPDLGSQSLSEVRTST